MKKTKGFTLIEIMVVIVILGVLSAIVVPKVIGRVSDARIQAAKSDIRTIESAISLYKMDNFEYPATEAGIRVLVERPSEIEAPRWKSGGYLKKLPTDPWGKPYLYINDGTSIDIFTLGSDQKLGGKDEAADIHYFDL